MTDMSTNRKRMLRTSKRRIPGNITQEYLNSLEARDFLSACSDSYQDGLTDEEAQILREHRKMEGAKSAD